MGKKTIKEFVSKVIYDRNIDPADVFLYILDSSRIRVVPFNFVRFGDEGFYYKGNFYPLYKILAIKDVATGDFLLLRKRDYLDLLRHEEIELSQYPYTLEEVYDYPMLIRNTPFIIRWLEEKVRKDIDFPWIEFFREIKVFGAEDLEFHVVLDEPFRYLGLVFREGSFYGAFRLLPYFYKSSMISHELQYQRIIKLQEEASGFDVNDIASCFFGKGFFCIDTGFKILSLEESPLSRKQQLDLMGYYIYFLKSSGEIIGIGHMKEKRLLTPRQERELIERIGLASVFDLYTFYTEEDLTWLSKKNLFLRISDFDQILIKTI